jgi:energy-coupling factor transporter ATP-binding protein EcfA2
MRAKYLVTNNNQSTRPLVSNSNLHQFNTLHHEKSRRHSSSLASVPHASSSSPNNNSQQQEENLADVMQSLFASLGGALNANKQSTTAPPTGAQLSISHLSYQPPGSPAPLLNNINMILQPNQLGLVYGKSGAGKSTLLQLIAGLACSTQGTISFSSPSSTTNEQQQTQEKGLSSQKRMKAAGLVFQFPERHFVGRTIAHEITAGWPSPITPAAYAKREVLSLRAYAVLSAVGLDSVSLETPLSSLSDGYKRRVALAVQLVRQPAILLLDEPLAGLDWRTRLELVGVIGKLKKECTIVVVSHDLRELAPLVDVSWCMKPGGVLDPPGVLLPP